MDSMDNFRERFEALEQRTEPLKQQTQARKAPTRPGDRRRWWPLAWPVAAVAALGLALALPLSVQAETFRCSAGDVPCLIAAINTANANGETNTIRLAAGTYTLTEVDNEVDNDPRFNANGLPVITSPLTITGRGADNTSIERATSAPGFRILDVAATGSLTLKRLTLRGGIAGEFSDNGGGGIRNQGTLALAYITVTDNNVGDGGTGGGILNTGTLTLMHSAVTDNIAGFGGGIATSGGTVTITHRLSDSIGEILGVKKR